VVDVERAASTVSFQAEALASMWEEALPLMKANHSETGALSDFHFAPALEKLKRLEEAGFVRLYTARRMGKLIGYQLFIVLFGINYPDNLEATCHVAYMTPGNRGFTAGKFLLWADRKLFYEGVYSIARQSTVKHPLSGVYQKMGYRKVEENWIAERGDDC
jgi:hypothetical protein